MKQFDSIFSDSYPRRPQKVPQHHDVISTLSSAVESMENAPAHAEQITSLDNDVAVSDSMNRPDFQVSFEDTSRQHLPFRPPPPPMPLDESKQAHAAEEAESMDVSSKPESSYSTVLTIRESTQPDGRTTYEAHTTPFVRTNDVEAPGATDSSVSEPRAPTTYIERLRHNRAMQAMSTKRRRRLKMKKHKWKKRLRATRSIRQKLDKT